MPETLDNKPIRLETVEQDKTFTVTKRTKARRTYVITDPEQGLLTQLDGNFTVGTEEPLTLMYPVGRDILVQSLYLRTPLAYLLPSDTLIIKIK